MLGQLTRLRLTLLVGDHAQAHAMGPGGMTERVCNLKADLPHYFPLPLPSWRSRLWATRNPWFEERAMQALRSVTRNAMDRT